MGGRARRLALAAALLGALPAGRMAAQDLATVRFTVAGPAALDSVRRLGIDVVEFRPRPAWQKWAAQAAGVALLVGGSFFAGQATQGDSFETPATVQRVPA